MRRFRQVVVSSAVAVFAFAAAPAASNAATCSGADSTATKPAVRATLCLLNAERRAAGLRPLRLDGKLNRAARGHSRDMVAQRYFAHESRNGAGFDDRIKRTGWTKSRRSYTMGENIAWGGGHLATPRSIVRSWMNSAGHKANILARDFRFIGIGVANGAPTGGSGATYTTTFGG
ncbi:CAP domain-containing protein [Solirubrobacter sp. CPCC 204708]|uniref:CAP domain-containing protein n=1 Tax=Solirubrobacter deserti TaxID=2282478 RepID=A0ABT4REF8_9ACTN|nr:CAP domain-containing protein [Solirubrobacter deserti]MBE2316167.1 CAP domain-containing protein [Solirubrobacter deserti]MDA0136916.1 CAP domain-containing protein [Solirubrobacter deserti]